MPADNARRIITVSCDWETGIADVVIMRRTRRGIYSRSRYARLRHAPSLNRLWQVLKGRPHSFAQGQSVYHFQ